MKPGFTVTRGVIVISLALAVCALTAPALADKVYLVGGGILEGEVTRAGSKVLIEIPSGVVALPAGSVERIEKGESKLRRFEARYAALRTGDVRGRLALAEFCRDNDMATREKLMLREVLAIDVDNAAARARLGYVNSEHGWLTKEASMRAQGLVERDGRWMSEREALELERTRLDTEAAAERRKTAEAELEARRVELSVAREAAERARSRAVRDSAVWVDGDAPVVVVPNHRQPQSKRCRNASPCRRKARPALGRPGFSPNSFESSMSVVKVPYTDR
jgi:hypothetical protein